MASTPRQSDFYEREGTRIATRLNEERGRLLAESQRLIRAYRERLRRPRVAAQGTDQRSFR